MRVVKLRTQSPGRVVIDGATYTFKRAASITVTVASDHPQIEPVDTPVANVSINEYSLGKIDSADDVVRALEHAKLKLIKNIGDIAPKRSAHENTLAEEK